MALVVGHSQTKYLREYLCEHNFSVFSYPGFRARHFLEEDAIFEVAPFFSVIVLVVGANDIGNCSTESLLEDIRYLCHTFHRKSPSATVLLSTILPRCKNKFEGCDMPYSYLSRWNNNAYAVNERLRKLALSLEWIRVIDHPQFYTMFGPNQRLLSKDGLHLSFEGTHEFASNIDQAVFNFPNIPSPKAETQCFQNVSAANMSKDIGIDHVPVSRNLVMTTLKKREKLQMYQAITV